MRQTTEIPVSNSIFNRNSTQRFSTRVSTSNRRHTKNHRFQPRDRLPRQRGRRKPASSEKNRAEDRNNSGNRHRGRRRSRSPGSGFRVRLPPEEKENLKQRCQKGSRKRERLRLGLIRIILGRIQLAEKLDLFKEQRHAADDDGGESISESTSSESEDTEISHKNQEMRQKNGALVTVDGEKQLELETLLKASAYILGASGSSIMYKAVLDDGTTLAVRRIGENGVERFRDFENQVRVIAKLVHPNLVRIRGFYWGTDEKLIIYDFVPNGSLANARYRKAGSSPCHLPWEMRLKIAKGVARGLFYIHEKKHVHGNLKPSNILLGPDMEPKIGDFGLERLVAGDNSSKAGGSARNFGSKRSTASRDSFQDYSIGPTPSPSPSIIVIVSDETGPALAIGASTSADEEKGKILRIADMTIRADMEGKEEALLALLRLGYGCICAVPQKRPSMKEVLQALERFPSSSFSSSYYYGH
ncbi:UNVERIFIED_CONTAM: putative LRR receptor-like serine/threonine-protein kinase [Sesamum calycinum]|uniref:non-specific serine/threonine protein kinase n=1 Tax=Sesamum calycinum TaxID=2727403 RepID=A0AAW2MNV8_9LAMI